MAVAFRDQTTSSAGNNQSFSFNIPAGTQNGDVLIFAIGSRKDFGGSPGPETWTLVRQDNGTQALRWRVYSLRWTTGMSTSITLTMNSSSDSAFASVVAYSGADSTSPVGASNGNTGGNTTNASVSQITPAAANSMIVECVMGYNGGTVSSYAIVTSNPTWTEANDNTCVAQAYGLRAAATATGNGTATISSAPDSFGMCILSLTPQSIVGPVAVKTWNGVDEQTAVKTYNGLALASTKSVNGVS